MTSATAGYLVVGKCTSFWLDGRYGLPARSISQDITPFVRFWVDFVPARRTVKTAVHSHVELARHVLPTATTFTFTHHDLAPRNILLDGCGKLWLLDWDHAGFCPTYFEYAAIYNFSTPPSWNWLARSRWSLFTWIAIGRFEQERRMLERMRTKFTRFPIGRRRNLLEIGGSTARPVS